MGVVRSPKVAVRPLVVVIGVPVLMRAPMGESTGSILKKLIIDSGMGRGYEGESSLIKNDVSGDHDTIGGKVKAAIPFVVWGIADENTLGVTGSKLMWGCRGQVGVACAHKNLEMLVGSRCVVEGGVGIGGSDGFHRKMVQQVCGTVETLYPKLWWRGSLKQ
jgi:hypothetical protein